MCGVQPEKSFVLREYLRVSQDRSGRGKSPDEQHQDNREVAKRRGWTLHPQPYRDDDRSASRYARRDREGFKQLTDDLEEGHFDADVLALWESSRGSRRVGEWVNLIELCEERGVRIWVTSDGKLYDPSDPRDRRSLLEDAVDAEYESAKTRKRVLRSTSARARAGLPHGATLYGYKRIYDPETRVLMEIVEHPEQAPIVKEAVQRVINGEPYYQIAKSYNDRGIPPRRPKQRKHRERIGWTGAVIREMVSNPAYRGLRVHRGEILPLQEGVEVAWPRLISDDDWKMLAPRIAKNAAVNAATGSRRADPYRAVHLLSGIARCGVCGYPVMTGLQYTGYKKPGDKYSDRPTYPTYVCRGQAGARGSHVTMRESHMDAVVEEVTLARLERPDILARLGAADDGIDEKRQALLDEIEGHRNWLAEVQQRAEQERNLDLLFGQQAIVEPKIREAQRQLESLVETDPLVLDLAQDDQRRERWGQLSLPDKRRVISSLMTPVLHKITPDWRGKKGINRERIEFIWK